MNDDIIKDIYDNIFKSVGKELYSNLYEPFSKGLIMMSRSLKNDIEQYNKQNINTLNQQSEDIKQSTTRLRQSFDNYTHSLNNFNNIFQNAIKTFNNKINDLDEYIKQTKADFYKNDIQEYKDAKRRYINSGDNEVDRQLLSDAISKFNEKQSINDEIIKLQREINHNAPEINKKLEELQKETILRDIRSKSSDIEHQYDVGKAILRDNENNDYEIKKRLEIAEYMSAIDSDTIKNIDKEIEHLTKVRHEANEEEYRENLIRTQHLYNIRRLEALNIEDEVIKRNLEYDVKRRQQQLEWEVNHQRLNQKNREEIVDSVEKSLINIFNSVPDLFLNNFKKGINDFNSAYESNFASIAGRTGADTRQETYKLIKNTLSEVNSEAATRKGLNFNSEVLPELNKVTASGFQGEEAQEIAISNAIDKKIMPWLDTSSQLWTNMQFTLEQDTLQQLKGQQLQLQETREGNRILQNGVANALTESLAPTLLNIEANTTDVTKLSSESQAIYQSYVDSGFSEQEALKATQHMIEIYQNPTKYLNGNASVSDILASQASLFGNSIVDIQKSQSDLYRVAGSAGRMSGFVTDAYGIPTGGQTRDAEIFNRISNAGELTEKYLEDFSISDINAQNKYNESVNNLPSKVTATQSVDNSMQNISAGVVSAFATIPHGLDTINLIYDTVDNIKKILIANYATDLMGRFFHSNRSGGGPLNGGSLGGNNVGENNGRLRNIISTQGNRLRNSLSRPEINLEELQAAEGLTGRVANTQLGEHLINFNNTSIGSVLSSPVAQFGGALAGGVVAYKGISDAKNYFNEDKNVRGTMSAISGTAGGVAAGALGASAIAGMAGATGAAALLGPIGWAALGIGAIGLGATKVVDHFTEITDASSTVTKNFKESAEAISKEYTERNNNIFAISEEIKNLDTTDEKLKYLQSQGLDPQIDLTKDVNGQLNEYLNSMMSANDALADEVQRISEDLQSKYKGEVNDQIEDVKKDLVEGYSKSALATKGYDKTRIENEQKRMLEAIGYSKEEIQAAFKHGINGALGEEELHDLLAWGQVKGKNLESFDDRFELDKVNTSGVRRMLSMSGSDIQFTDWNQVASESGQYMNAIAYLNKYKEYGKEKGKITDNIPAEFNQKEYDKYKKLILDAPEDHKKLINDIFVESYNNSEAMSDWPNSLKGYKLGSKYIGYDQLAMLHRGERVLTENENNFYTSQYTNLTEDISNLNKNMTNSSIIVSSAQDIISAINLQTKEIVNALKNQSISIDSNNLATSQMNNNIFNDSQLSPVSLLPSMSMTRVLE